MEVSSRIRNAALTALGILVALGVVAIASRGETPSSQVGDRHASDVLLDILFAFYLVGIFLGALLLLYMIFLHRKFQHEGMIARRNLLQTVLGMLALPRVRASCSRAGWPAATRSSRPSRRSSSFPAAPRRT